MTKEAKTGENRKEKEPVSKFFPKQFVDERSFSLRHVLVEGAELLFVDKKIKALQGFICISIVKIHIDKLRRMEQ